MRGPNESAPALPARVPSIPEITTIPSSDRAFAEYVRQLVRHDHLREPDELAGRLRRLFPRASVRARVLAGETPRWYVYRDGQWLAGGSQAWWRRRGVPRVLMTLDGWIRAVSPSARSLFELDGDERHHFADFVAPGTLRDATRLFEIVANGATLDATIRIRPLTGDVIACELHAQRKGDALLGALRLADDIPPLPATPPSSPQLAIDPSDDIVFSRYAERILASLAVPSAEELAIRLRRLYPHAQVLAEGEIWRVSRDRDVAGERGAGEAWWDDPALPRVTYDDQGLLLAANPAALRLLGSGLVGRHWQDLVTPGSTAQVAPVLAMIREAGTAVSRFRMPAADGRLVEFDSYTRFADDQYLTVMRPR